MIEVTVHNEIEDPGEGTSIHWHGFLLHYNAWMDGTSGKLPFKIPRICAEALGFTQCPIPPGKSFTYTFKAELFGTSWYHAHYSAQYADGAFGPIVVYGPWDNKAYDIDIGPITLNDFYHDDWYSMVQKLTAPRLNQPPPMPTSDSNLINGKMRSECVSGAKCSPNAGLSQFYFKSGKNHRLRLMNTGADGAQQFSIDDHDMTVVANDFVPIEPYTTNVVTLGVGQRTDVIVQGIGKPNSSYWMRSNITCANSLQPNAKAVIYYENADTSKLPDSYPQQYSNVGCANDALDSTVPAFVIDPGEPETTIVLDATVGQNTSGVWL
jgi:FtsP/CotA-like multicopper oxidase with cupredoxin domain